MQKLLVFMVLSSFFMSSCQSGTVANSANMASLAASDSSLRNVKTRLCCCEKVALRGSDGMLQKDESGNIKKEQTFQKEGQPACAAIDWDGWYCANNYFPVNAQFQGNDGCLINTRDGSNRSPKMVCCVDKCNDSDVKCGPNDTVNKE